MAGEGLQRKRVEGAEANTISASVLQQIRADIIKCKLNPGDKLRSDDLRRKYGVGVSPLREALSRLVVEGLVTSEGQRGFRVAPTSIADFEEVTQLRCELENIAIRDAIYNGGDEWEAAIAGAFHHLSLIKRFQGKLSEELADEWERRHRAFHESLIAACGNRKLLTIIRHMVDQTERYRHVAIAYSDIPRKDELEHKAIMNAVLARDAAKACSLLTKHFNKTVEMVKELL